MSLSNFLKLHQTVVVEDQLNRVNGRVASESLDYPVFLIENDRKNQFTGFNIVYRPTGYSVWGRVPNANKYQEGQMFDASGRIFKYAGSSGWFRFSPKVCSVLDSLILPGLVSKLFEALAYYGPALMTGEKVDIEEFKHRLLASIERYGSKDLDQLSSLVSKATDFVAVLEAVDWWRYNGGTRDEDGHPISAN